MARTATGQVLERKGARGRTFALRFHAYGRREYVRLGTSDEGWTRERAEAELANVLADVRRGVWRPGPPPVEQRPEPSFHEFASEWFDRHRQELRPRTREDYQWALTHHLLPFFAKHRLSQITIEEVDRYRAHKLREGALAANTLNKTITRLAQVLEVAVEYGYLSANPARGRRRRAKATTPQRSWLEPEQVKPLVDAAAVRGQRGGHLTPAPRTRAIVATAVCSGLRVSELLALRWRDVDLATGRIAVRSSKTDAGQRTIDVWPELRDELLAWKARAPHAGQADYVFATSTGQPDSRANVARALRRAVERANELLEGDVAPLPDVTPHSLRRTFASLLYERGEDPVYVMDQMGHSDPKLALRIYTKVVARKRRRGAGDRLVGVLDGVQWAQTGTTSAPSPGPEDLLRGPENDETRSGSGFQGVGRAGLEPATSSLSSWRSPD